MSPALKHNPESDELSQKVPLGENFAWWVFRRKTAAANDCCIREKREVKLRLVSGERFPGQYYDSETGLYYNHFRYYNPGTGRYITSDPIGLDGGLNTYIYVTDNPVNYIDLLGLVDWNPDENSSSTNCYNYALGRMGYGNPGGYYLFPRATCDKLIEGAKKDGLIDPTENKGDCGGKCPDGYYKVQIYLDDTNIFDRDYHAYRQNSDGSWSNKLGRSGYPRRSLSCPMGQSRKFPRRHYRKYCGTLCKKDI